MAEITVVDKTYGTIKFSTDTGFMGKVGVGYRITLPTDIRKENDIHLGDFIYVLAIKKADIVIKGDAK